MIILLMKLMMIYSYNILLYWYWSLRFTLITKVIEVKLEVTRGIECGERGYGDESGECGVCWEWDGGVGCGSNRVKLRLNVEMDVIMMEMNVELNVEMVMLKRLVLLPFLFLLFILLFILFLINLNLLFQFPLFPSYNFSLYLL